MYDDDLVERLANFDLNQPLELPQSSLDGTRSQPPHAMSPLSTVPIYCGKDIPRGYLQNAAREFTYSPEHFIKSLASKELSERLCYPNPKAIQEDLALGIMLVNFSNSL